MVHEPSPEQHQKKRRGRPPGGAKERPGQQDQATQQTHASASQKNTGHHAAQDAPQQAGDEELQAGETATPFSAFLQSIMRRDHSELTRVARELDVAENTVYRWLNGTSEPRVTYLKRLPDIFPEHRAGLSDIINQTFGTIIAPSAVATHDLDKEIYRQVLSIVAQSQDEEARFWEVTRAVFEHLLQHLDQNKQGLAVTYAKLMPPHVDGIHSLREVLVRGHYPWPETAESLAFLGSTTLAGLAATSQRMQTWNDTDAMRSLAEIDENERSACAVPIIRSKQLAGVMIISSTQPTFFNDPQIDRAVAEYGLLMSAAIHDNDFHPPALLQLRPLPDLPWQRQKLSEIYADRIVRYAHTHTTSRREAEFAVQHELELEFEEEARTILE